MVGVVAAVCISVLLLIVVARVAQLQLRPTAALASHIADRQTTRVDPSVRGEFLDRRGRLLSATRFGYRAFIDPELFPDGDERDAAIVALTSAAAIDAEKLAEKVYTAENTNELRRFLRAEYGEDQPQVRGPLRRFIDRVTGHEEPEWEPVPSDGEKPPPLVRFVPVSDVLSEERAAAVRALRIPGIGLERRAVRESPAAELAEPLLGRVGFDHEGLFGAEYEFQDNLKGQPGGLTFTRDAWGRPLWVAPGGATPSRPGQDIRLSLDLELQRIVVEELTKGAEEFDAAGVRCVLVDPLTGEVLALADVLRAVPDAKPFPWVDAPQRDARGRIIGARPSSAPPPPGRYVTIKPSAPGHPPRNRCVEDVYEPGSTFKSFVWATITEMGLIRPDDVLDTEGGVWVTNYGRRIADVVREPTMTWREVLINSSNIGMVKGGQKLSFKQLRSVVQRFGFGKPTRIGLPGEASGIVTSGKDWSQYTQTSVSFGHEIAVTPVQMARAFCAIARPGELAGTLPSLRLTAAEAEDAALSIIDRVLPAHVATLTRDTLADVAEKVETNLARGEQGVSGWRYSMFGKSGTAEIPLGPPPKGKRAPAGVGYFDNQYNSSFLAGAPQRIPRLVICVVVDDPGPELVRKRMHYGSRTAGPIARRILERSLTYLGIPPDRDLPPVKPVEGVASAGAQSAQSDTTGVR